MKMTKKGITDQFCFELIDTAYVSRLQKRLKMYTSFFLIQQNKNLRKTVHDNIYYSWQIAWNCNWKWRNACEERF